MSEESTVPDHKARAHAIHNASAAKIWEDCDLYYHFKIAAEDAGEVYDTSGPAAERGTAMHEISEIVLAEMLDPAEDENEQAFTDRLSLVVDGAADRIEALRRAQGKAPVELVNEDLEQVEIAIRAVLEVVWRHPEAEVALEAQVPLSHEPSSTGAIDVAMWDENALWVIDYKYGRGEVEADSTQLKIYAANLEELLSKRLGKQWEPKQIHLGIVQPRLRREMLVHTMDRDELLDFQEHIERIVADQISGRRKMGASNIGTCEWCPFFRNCAHRVDLVQGLVTQIQSMTDPNTGGLDLSADPKMIENVVRQAKGIEAVIRDCKQRIIEDEETFPDWRRQQVSNGRKWNVDVLEMSEIAHRLRKVGAQEIYTLRPVGQIMKEYPQVESLVEDLALDQGHHIRLKYVGDESRDRARNEDAPPPAPAIVERAAAAMKRAAPPEKEGTKTTSKAGKAKTEKNTGGAAGADPASAATTEKPKTKTNTRTKKSTTKSEASATKSKTTRKTKTKESK